MTTSLDVIKGAMKDIGAIQSGEAPTSEEANDALDTMKQMIAMWELEGIAIGVQDLTLSGTINLPENHIYALRANLAVRLCPEYGLQPNPITVQLASDGYTALQGAYGEPNDMTIDGAIRRRWYWPSGYSY